MTLREYLVKLGFKVDDTSWAKFNQRLETSASNAAYLGKTMTLAAIEIGIAVERLTANYERLYYVSQRTGSSVASLKAYEFSARQIGLTAEQAQSSVESFATAMRLNPGVRSLFAGLGVDTKDAVKGIGQMIDIFKAKFGEQGYFIASRMAQLAGQDEATFRQMWTNRDKQAAQDRAAAERRRAAGIDDKKLAEDSVKFQDSLRILSDRWGILADKSIGGFIPKAIAVVEVLDKMVDGIIELDKRTNGWVGTIGTLVAALGALKAASAVLGLLGRAVGAGGGAAAAASGAGAAAGSLGARALLFRLLGPVAAFGWALGLGGEAQGATLPGGAGSAHPSDLPGGAGSPRDAALNYFQSRGWSREQAAGITANGIAESNLNHRIPGDGGQAYGAFQWHPDRQADFQRWSGKSIRESSLQEQLAFVHYELTEGKEQLAGRALKNARTAGESGSIISRMYERPRDVIGEASRRGALAETILASPSSGSGVQMSQNTNITVNGATDPRSTASAIGREQDRVNGNIVRNTKSMVQ